MTENEIERLVTRILARIQPPALVMVDATQAYRQAIHARLSAAGQNLHVALFGEVTDIAHWQSLGETFSVNALPTAQPLASYRALILPFLSYFLAAELVSGVVQSPEARCLHEALLAGVPVLALRYHCDPTSELNQLRGTAMHSAYALKMQATLSQLAGCGITLCTMDELLTQLASPTVAAPVSDCSHRYITVADVVNNPALATASDAMLTDAARDFLRNSKK